MTHYIEVAQTIIDQLGGEGRLRRMIGARSFLPDKGKYGLGRVSIAIPSNLTNPKINVIRIELTPADLYEIVCEYNTHGLNRQVKEVALAHDVFVGDLHETIYQLTGGLVTQMPRIEVQR